MPLTSLYTQLISELDITGGDEKKVGYYAGLIVRSLSLIVQSDFDILTQPMRLGVYILRYRSDVCVSMVTTIGPHRAEACSARWLCWHVHLHDQLRAIADVLGTRSEVRLCRVSASMHARLYCCSAAEVFLECSTGTRV